MAEHEKRQSEEFYEAMPGTMAQPGMRSDEMTRNEARVERREEDVARPSLLPWLLIPAALLLGWMILSAMNNANNNNGNTNTGNTNGSAGQTQTELTK